MSDQPLNAESGDQSAATTTKRSPRERWVVRGVIVILLVVTVVQARAWFGYHQTLSTLRGAVRAHEQTAEAPELTLSMVGDTARGTIFKATPSVGSDAGTRESTVSYSWNGLLKSYRLDLIVTADGEDPAILEVVPEGAPAKADAVAPSERWVRMVEADTGIIQGLLAQSSIRFELGMTPSQGEQVEELASDILLEIDAKIMGKPAADQQEIWKELELRSRSSFLSRLQDVLDDEQYQRYLGLTLQARGAAAISWPEVSAELELTDEQLSQHSEILSERESKFAELRSTMERISHMEAYEERMLALLTADQRGKWNDLMGPPSPAVKPWSELDASE